jgi:HD-GYP domain-containing protein (c-di-GMP phosphodiesterase class II)
MAQQRQLDLLTELLNFVEQTPGLSVSKFLSRVLLKIREITHAEAGTIYMVRGKGENRWLEPASIQNDAIRLRPSSYSIPFTAPSIVGYVARTGKSLLIDDVYQLSADKPYHFYKEFDELHRYESRSLFCFSIPTFEGKPIGVVQLINSKVKNKIIPFSQDIISLIQPITQIVGRAIERMDTLEKIASKNDTLRQRNRALMQQKAKIAAAQVETEEAFMLSIRLLAKAAEIHDEDTGNHILRVNEYSYFMARTLGLPQSFCDEIRFSAQLHDVGKMSVDASILKKKGLLTDSERTEMNLHTLYGYQILLQSDRLELAAEIAYCHHEKWDGTGYPRGLKGEEIPISARIVQIADIYDALRSERPYKRAFSHEEAYNIILVGDNRIDPKSHFDPKLMKLFETHHQVFCNIFETLKDAPHQKIIM